VAEYQTKQYRGVMLARMKHTLMYRVEILPLTHDGRRQELYYPEDGFHPILNLATMWPTYDKVGDRFVACSGCQEGNNVAGMMWRLGCGRQRAEDWVKICEDTAWEGCLVRGPVKFPPRKPPKMRTSTLVMSGWI
jgi:hypothetical protein